MKDVFVLLVCFGLYINLFLRDSVSFAVYMNIFENSFWDVVGKLEMFEVSKTCFVILNSN